MAKKMVDNCVQCGLPCQGSLCPNNSVSPQYTCDECKDEFEPEELFDFDGDMFCKDCLLEQFKTVKQMEELNGENYYG